MFLASFLLNSEKTSRGLLSSHIDSMNSLSFNIESPQSDVIKLIFETLSRISAQPQHLEISLPLYELFSKQFRLLPFHYFFAYYNPQQQ